jgi:outer membrane protein
MVFRTISAAILLTSAAFAQTSSFPKASYFREVLAKPQMKIDLRAPVKLKDYVVDGKLRLSLKQYLELVMANNTDVQVQYLTMESPKNNILSAYGIWDPSLSMSFSTQRSNSASFGQDGFIDGSVSKSLSQPFSTTYSQTLPSGMNYSATFGATKSSSQSYGGFGGGGSFNPSMATSLNLAVTQPLIKNRGTYINKIGLMQAQGRYRSAGFSLRNSLINLVNQAEGAYWSAVSARESLVVQVQARDTAKALADYVAKQFSLGAIADLDTYNSQSSLAGADSAVVQSQSTLTQAEDTLRKQIAVDLDPDVRNLPLELTEPVDLAPSEIITPDREQSIQKAIATSPQLRVTLQSLDLDDLSIQSAKNGLLPDLKLTMRYTNSATDGSYYGNDSSGNLTLLSPGGLGGALGSLFGFHAPVYYAGLSLTLPIRSRSATASLANSLVSKKNDVFSLRNQQQGIRLNVLNAITALEGAKKGLETAEIQKKFSDLDYAGMDLKYRLGSEIQQNVVSAQQRQASANLSVVNAKILVRRSILALYTQMGTLLDERGIIVQ